MKNKIKTKSNYEEIQYKENFGYFIEWSKEHRKHQLEAIEACEKHKLGQVTLPTATGKTRIQISIHLKEMISMQQNNTFACFVIGAHRLVLCSQLIDSILEEAFKCGISLNILFIGSDKYDNSIICNNPKYKNLGLNSNVLMADDSMNSSKILDYYEKSVNNGRHLICVSTYHSFFRLNKINKIKICTFDEAHVLTNRLTERETLTEFQKNFNKVKNNIERSYFFTATRKIIGEYGGMNDIETYGDILYKKSPRDMIDAGEIVEPRIHILSPPPDGNYDNHTMYINSAIEGFQKHRDYVKKESCSPNDIGAKLLITTAGTRKLNELHNDERFKIFSKENNIQVFAFCSAFGIFAYHNFIKMSRKDVMKKMKDLKDPEDAILIHIDILTEGIDIPSITGVIPYRELEEDKLFQNLGRACRLISNDRNRLYTNQLSVGDYKNYLKPYCYFIIPHFFQSVGNYENMEKTISRVINFYEIPVGVAFIGNNFGGDLPDEDVPPISPKDDSIKNDKTGIIKHSIENVIINHAGIKSETDARKALQIIKDHKNKLRLTIS